MIYDLELLHRGRENFLKVLDQFDIDDLNKIPDGFSNNLIWNFGHSIVVQQQLCYGLSGLDMLVDSGTISQFKAGSKPSGLNTSEDLERLKNISNQALIKLEKDLDNDVFQVYKTITTSLNVTMRSAKEGLTFNNVHEGVHLGIMLSLRKHI